MCERDRGKGRGTEREREREGGRERERQQHQAVSHQSRLTTCSCLRSSEVCKSKRARVNARCRGTGRPERAGERARAGAGGPGGRLRVCELLHEPAQERASGTCMKTVGTFEGDDFFDVGQRLEAFYPRRRRPWILLACVFRAHGKIYL